ncbi:peroxisome assembly protein 26 [Mixophyes fleayi]|uniref:peroxisome assembly protein 26 n=1 Tax=Mixophyes fleayi TaxID=3061075 RepID=UPI003F4E12B2
MAVTENVSSCSLSAMWDWSHWSLSGTPPAVSLLDAAADLLVLERNFAGALELCERGLQILVTEPGDTRNKEVKDSLGVIGIQALAEMERWREVLPWVLQYYRTPQEMPHNIMELCLLLYSRVKQPHVMLDLSRDWLKEHADWQPLGYGRVAELHLSKVLLPLGHFSEAEELAQDPGVFTERQQQAALTLVREERRRLEQEEEAKAETERPSVCPPGNLQTRHLQVARTLYGALCVVARWIRRIPFRQVLLALLLMSVILLRLDPASPMSQGPVSSLLLLLRQIVSSVFQNPPTDRP